MRILGYHEEQLSLPVKIPCGKLRREKPQINEAKKIKRTTDQPLTLFSRQFPAQNTPDSRENSILNSPLFHSTCQKSWDSYPKLILRASPRPSFTERGTSRYSKTLAVLEVDHLTTNYKTLRGWVKACEDVSFQVEKGEAMGLVGESGCGKTTVALSLLKLLPSAGRIRKGQILFNGKDLVPMSDSQIRKIRWKGIALDVVVQAQILKLLRELKDKLNLSMVFISHDLSIVAETCEKLAIMYAGQVVEYGDTKSVFSKPLHPYTQGLLGAFPSIKGERKKLISIPGQPPDLLMPPTGCRFNPRCPYVMDVCKKVDPKMLPVDQSSHLARCHLYPQE